jgi:hypothetical protein
MTDWLLSGHARGDRDPRDAQLLYRVAVEGWLVANDAERALESREEAARVSWWILLRAVGCR